MAALERAAFAEALDPLPGTFELTPIEEARARICEALASDGVRALVLDGEEGLAALVVLSSSSGRVRSSSRWATPR